MERWWPNERKIKQYEKLGNFSIEPYGSKYYAVYDGNDLVCVTVYKKGALEVMERLHALRKGGETFKPK